jgi:hypothetical protein
VIDARGLISEINRSLTVIGKAAGISLDQPSEVLRERCFAFDVRHQDGKRFTVVVAETTPGDES